MYQYNRIDQTLVDERVAEFRDQTRRYLAGRLSEDEFRPLRLMNGLYFERQGPMLRINIPYGELSAAQLRKLARITRVYDRGYGHFTTRQNLQINHPRVEEVPDLLAELAEVQMHAIQSSGNCIRNITADPLSGIAPDEAVDPRPYCELLRQWSTLHPEFAYLPRKFKIAVSGARNDRAAVRIHDIGLHLVTRDGETGAEVWVGGGLGRLPMLGERVRGFVPEREILAYLEAILRVYNRYGRRDNPRRARIKVLVREYGIDAFTDAVEAEYARLAGGALTLSAARIEAMKAHFRPPSYRVTDPAGEENALTSALAGDAAFARWVERNVADHKVPGYRAVHLSLKRPGTAPGDITSEQLLTVAALSERFGLGEVRTTHHQNLVLPDVRASQLPDLHRELTAAGLATPTVGLLTDPICCPGWEFCSLANAGSIPVAKAILDHFDDLDYVYDLGDLRLNLSGCMNACGHHHVGHIGILGVDKKGEEWYQIQLGGASAGEVSLGRVLGPAVPKDEVPMALQRIVERYVELRRPGEPFLKTVRRAGLALFKEALHAVV